MLSSCLVDDPPAYRAPQQTAPQIHGARALPRLDRIITTSTGTFEHFDVPIVSEDAGEGLSATLFLDYLDANSEPLKSSNLPPSTLDEGERSLKFVWTVRTPRPGCHRLTLRVAHDSSWSNGDVVDLDDLAEAYWFANINVTAQNANVLVDCPSASDLGAAQ